MKRRVLPIVCVAVVLGLYPARVVYSQASSTDQIQQHYHRAETAWKNRTSLLEAKVRVDRVLEEAPNHADALKLRAEVLIAMRRYREAIGDAQRATELNKEDGSAYLILAEAARLHGDKMLARRALDTAAMLSMEEGADFHLKLSRSAMLLGEPEWTKAESYARVARAKDPQNPEVYYQLARVFMVRGRADDAATILEQGFQASLLDPVYIRNDSTLSDLNDHVQLVPYLEP